MNITIVGTGYVGLVSGACFAELGHTVTCVDIDKRKVELINSGNAPIFEPGLDELLKRHVGKTLRATAELSGKADAIFICVGTPSREDGSTDLKYIEGAARDIGRAIKTKKNYCVVVVKSTVPPGTTERVKEIIETESAKGAGRDFGVAMNPEFLPEGNAINDFMKPDRTVIGALDDKSFEAVSALYKTINAPVIRTDVRTAEMIKYTSNALLATKISFSNEIGNICKALGIDVYEVMRSVGMDKRIGPYFLNAGLGYGGSCFRKDVQSLIHTAKENGVDAKIIRAVEETNEKQPLKIIELAKKKLGLLKNKKITVLGLAFKPNSDDMREAPSIKIINALVREGAIIKAYDPKANENAKKIIGNKIEYATTLNEALEFAPIIFILTEWDAFKDEKLYNGKTVFDGRKALDKRTGSGYEGVCW